MAPRSRYRVEDGRSCIEIQLKTARQLFDLRDPAPFRERDLDPAAAAHIMACLHEIPARSPVRIVLHLAERDPTLDDSTITEAIRSHFQHERDVVVSKIHDNFRHGRHLFVLGLVILGIFLVLSRLSMRALEGAGVAGEILKEGLMITGWVAMWRPAEVLLYDWWPLYDQRRWIDKLLESEVEVRARKASIAPAA